MVENWMGLSVELDVVKLLCYRTSGHVVQQCGMNIYIYISIVRQPHQSAADIV